MLDPAERTLVDAALATGWKQSEHAAPNGRAAVKLARAIKSLHLEHTPATWLAYFANIDRQVLAAIQKGA